MKKAPFFLLILGVNTLYAQISLLDSTQIDPESLVGEWKSVYYFDLSSWYDTIIYLNPELTSYRTACKDTIPWTTISLKNKENQYDTTIIWSKTYFQKDNRGYYESNWRGAKGESELLTKPPYIKYFFGWHVLGNILAIAMDEKDRYKNFTLNAFIFQKAIYKTGDVLMFTNPEYNEMSISIYIPVNKKPEDIPLFQDEYFILPIVQRINEKYQLGLLLPRKPEGKKE